MNILKKFKVAIIIASIGIVSFTSYAFVDNYFEVSKNLDIFATLYREVNMYYVDETKPGELIQKGIDAMLESLDPYTNYISESDIEDYRYMTTGQYGGVGSLIRKKGEYVVITDPYENYPAFKAGLRAGDLILEVDGKSVKGKETDEISKILKGQPGTTLKLLIKREGDKENIEKSVTREEIKISSVPYHGMLNDEIGYIQLTGFTEDAGQDVKKALVDLKEKNNIKGLVFDLRRNPGGLLNEAVNISNLFVDRGQEIVNTKGKVKEWEKSYKALNSAVDLQIPIVVLVNSGSASASEIVSGSLQDLDRAVILGQRTFGKGLVQTTRNLTYNSKLKVTTAKYYIPSGRCIQALDYSNRNDDGSVGKVPDSLITKFKTKAGRIVYDGGGIKPDITTEVKRYSKIVISLDNKMLLFDYATKYRLEHAAIAPAKSFKLSEKEYNYFTEWLGDKEYDYTTQSEQMMKDLKETASKEKYYANITSEYEALKAKMMHNKKEDLVTFKDEIKEMLELEIASRYYYQNGRTENSFRFDYEVNKAIELLKDNKKYNSILVGTYKEEAAVEKKN